MAQIIIEYDARNSSAQKLLDAILSLPFFKVKEEDDKCPYDKKFMAKIEKNAKSPGKVIKTEDLWK